MPNRRVARAMDPTTGGVSVQATRARLRLFEQRAARRKSALRHSPTQLPRVRRERGCCGTKSSCNVDAITAALAPENRQPGIGGGWHICRTTARPKPSAGWRPPGDTLSLNFAAERYLVSGTGHFAHQFRHQIARQACGDPPPQGLRACPVDLEMRRTLNAVEQVQVVRQDAGSEQR